MRIPVWFDLGEADGVLELAEGRAGALELQVVVDSESDRTIAWWENERGGAWLIVVDAGVA